MVRPTIRRLAHLLRTRALPQGVRCEGRVFVDRGVRVNVAPGGHLLLRDGATLGRDVGIAVGRGATLTIGMRTRLQPRTRINAMEAVDIGADCAISWGVDILDSDFHQIVLSDGSRPRKTGPVRIGDHVWIGVGAKILKGVTIGQNCVIAAGSVVTTDVPEGSLAAGVPARVVKPIQGWDH